MYSLSVAELDEDREIALEAARAFAYVQTREAKTSIERALFQLSEVALASREPRRFEDQLVKLSACDQELAEALKVLEEKPC